MTESHSTGSTQSHGDGKLYTHAESLDGTQMRVMLLHGGAPEEPLSCSFEVFPVQTEGQSPAYVALSYVWGSSPADHEVWCNGRKLPIRQNLASALIRFRPLDPNKSLWMWADQLCIDQTNDTERSAQVNIMDHIFSDAGQVWIWLGSSENGDVSRLQLLYALGKESDWVDFESTKFPSDEVLAEKNLPLRDSPLWQALNNLLSNPYWKRIWVIQEVVLAKVKRVFWGREEIAWETILGVSAWSPRFGLDNVPFELCPASVALLLEGLPSKRWPLGELTQMTRGCLLSEPRDSFFALLSISRPLIEGAVSMQADYSKSFDQVCAMFTKFIIEDEKNLDQLSQVVNRITQTLQKSCTWAFKPLREVYPKPFVLFTEAHNASRQYVVGLKDKREDSLYLKGLRIGRVSRCTGDMDPEGASFLENLSNAWSMSANGGEAQEQHSKLKEFVWTLSAGNAPIGALGLGSPATEQILISFAKYISVSVLRQWLIDSRIQTCPRACLYLADFAVRCYDTLGCTPHRKMPYSSELLKFFEDSIADAHPTGVTVSASSISRLFYRMDECSATDYPKILIQTATSRAFFITADGDMGLGPLITEKDDIICVLLGGKTPYILRATNTPGEYLFVGECYIMKWMDGLAIDLMNDGTLEPEWFDVR